MYVCSKHYRHWHYNIVSKTKWLFLKSNSNFNSPKILGYKYLLHNIHYLSAFVSSILLHGYKLTCCSCRRPDFGSQRLHWWLISTETPASGDLMPSSHLHGHKNTGHIHIYINKNISFYLFLFHVHWCFGYMCLWRVPDLVELELQIVVSCHVGAETWTQVLRNSSKRS